MCELVVVLDYEYFISNKLFKCLIKKINIHNELYLFTKYCRRIFTEKVVVEVCTHSNYYIKCKHAPTAFAINGKVSVSETMLQYPNILFYKYILHEIIHQHLGYIIKIEKENNLFLLESYTEYLQTVYLKQRFDDKIYIRTIKISNKYIDNRLNDEPMLADITMDLFVEEMDTIHYGIIVLHLIIEANINKIIYLNKQLEGFNCRINYFSFKKILLNLSQSTIDILNMRVVDVLNKSKESIG